MYDAFGPSSSRAILKKKFILKIKFLERIMIEMILLNIKK